MALVCTYYDIELKPLPTQLTSAPPGHAALPSALGPRTHRLSALLSIGVLHLGSVLAGRGFLLAGWPTASGRVHSGPCPSQSCQQSGQPVQFNCSFPQNPDVAIKTSV